MNSGHLALNFKPIFPCVIYSKAATISRHGAVGSGGPGNHGTSIPGQRSSRRPQRSMATGPRPRHHTNGMGPSSWPRNQPSPGDGPVSPSPRPCSSGCCAPSRNAKRDRQARAAGPIDDEGTPRCGVPSLVAHVCGLFAFQGEGVSGSGYSSSAGPIMKSRSKSLTPRAC